MRNLIILAFCSIFFVHSSANELPDCDKKDSLLIVEKCGPLLQELFGAVMDKIVPTGDAKTMAARANVCNEVEKCLEPIKCKQAVTMWESTKIACSDFPYLDSDNRDCIEEFFQAAVRAHYSSTKSCLTDYGFLEENLSKRRKAYIDGKACFLKHVKKSCTKTSQEHFTSNYDDFVGEVSTRPEPELGSENCAAIFHAFNGIRCIAIGVMTNERIKFDLKHDDPLVPRILKMCRDVKICVEDPCDAGYNLFRDEVLENCKLLEATNSLRRAANGEL